MGYKNLPLASWFFKELNKKNSRKIYK